MQCFNVLLHYQQSAALMFAKNCPNVLISTSPPRTSPSHIKDITISYQEPPSLSPPPSSPQSPHPEPPQKSPTTKRKFSSADSMSAITPARPSRRAAASRRKIVESSSSEGEAPPSAIKEERDDEFKEEEEEEEEALQASRRKSRRITANPAAGPSSSAPKNTRAGRRVRSGGDPRAARVSKPRAPRTTKPKPASRKSEPPEVEVTPEPDPEATPKATPRPTPPPDPQATPRARSEALEEPQDSGNYRSPSPGRTPTPGQRSKSGTPAPPQTPLKTLIAEIKSSPSSKRSPTAATPRPGSRDSMMQPPLVVKSRTNALFEQQQAEELAGPKPRLVITHLVLVNFKSYAGRQEVGPFHVSFSSVVGPNGSGKSNVIDSLLFVFGFRASKMRQGKISALIHNSANFPNLDYCEVEVHFREVLDSVGGGESIPIPDSTLIVSRRAFKNNSSKYYINGATSDYTQVTTLLRGRGIDLDHKRFLILQGEVESIAQMKPKAQGESDDGLLEYLEDIIGTSKYKQPIEESATQVEELNEVCVEKSARVQHVEKEKISLEDKKDVALEFLRNENDLALKKAALYQVHIADSDTNVSVTSDMITQLQAQLDEELERRGGNEAGIKKLEKKYKQGAKEVEEVEEATKSIMKEMSRNDKENVKFQEKEKFLTQKQKKLQKSIQTNKLSASEATALIEKHTQDIDRYSAEISEFEQNLKVQEAELEKIRDNLKEKTQGFSDKIATKQKSLEPWKEKINEKQSAIAVAQSELDILHEKSNASNLALEEVRAKIVTIQGARTTKEQELKECRKECVKLEKEAMKVQMGLDKIADKEPALRSNLSSARQKADEAKASLSATQTQGNVLMGLMRLKESGRIEGFHGRLGNLGTIDAKFDVAISTACPQLDNMVVDTVEVGQQCIDYLRKNNLGRANFICLNKLQARDLNPISTPDNVPRLFDLVKPKSPIFAPAFYSVLQNTLVAENLPHANRIAYGAKRWRVVTLDGQLIDKSGTMTGGGTTVSKGRMSSKLVAETSRDQVAKLETDRDAQERTYQEFQTQQRELGATLRDLKERIPETQVMISKIELELESSSRHLADAEKRVRELSVKNRKSNVDESVGRVNALGRMIAKLESEIEDLNAETSGIEDEIRALQGRIMEVGGIKLRSQKGKVDGIREQLETANEQVAAADLARVKAEKNLAKAEKAFTNGTEELDTIGVNLDELKEEIKEHQRRAQESSAKADEAQAYLEEKKEELALFKADLDEKLADLNKTRAAEIEMKNKLEEHHKVLADNQKRSHHWQKELGKLGLHNISDLGGPESEPQENLDLPIYTEDELADLDKNKLNAQIAVLEEKIQGVNVDLAVLQEYRRRVEEHAIRAADLETSVTSRDSVKHRLDDLRKRRLEEFMEGFSTISLRLKEMYQMITMGGNAELELVDSLDPFSEGILFSVMPPKKSWKNISNLSGGEKTLSSLALVFALHHYKPTPLYVMDEIDAALDFRNVSIVASYIKERTKNAQFIVISLRNNMFELAARLVGVYKVNHMTKSVTIENRDYIERR